MNNKVKNTTVPQTVAEYDAELAKREESIHDKKIDGISSGLQSLCVAGIGYFAGDILGDVCNNGTRFTIYGVFGLFTIGFIVDAVKKLGMAAILKKSYREMETRRNQLEKSMVNKNER